MPVIGDEAFASLMAGLNLPESPRRLAVAVSGGSDSMALALLASRWAAARSVPLFALTVDHGIRPEAAAEAVQVKDWLAAFSIPCDILTPDAPIEGSNLQEKAREARYRLMSRQCEALGVEHLLLAHHADDQLETLLMRLIRAGGIEGLAGMRPVSCNYGLMLLRPLLTVAKQELRETLEAAGQTWLEDPSNRAAAYTRNRLRPVAAALAAEGLSPVRLGLLTSQLASVADYFTEEMEAWLAAHAEYGAGGAITLPLDCWQTVPREIGWRALRRLVVEAGEAQKLPRSEKLLPLFEALAAGALDKPRTLSGCLLKPNIPENRIYFSREP